MGLGFAAAFRSIRRTLQILEAEDRQASEEQTAMTDVQKPLRMTP